MGVEAPGAALRPDESISGAALPDLQAAAARDVLGKTSLAFTSVNQAGIAVPMSHPYFAGVQELDRASGWNPRFSFTPRQLLQRQQEIAAEAGLLLGPDEAGFEVIGGQGAPANRLAGKVKAKLGVRTLWRPMENFEKSRSAAFNPQANAIFSDAYTPLAARPTPMFVHEVLHAWVDRGPAKERLAPLRTLFRRFGSFAAYRKYEHELYGLSTWMRADEILTWFSTNMLYARALAHKGAPQEERQALFTAALDTSLFAIESVGRMAAKLAPAAAELARSGLDGKPMASRHGYVSVDAASVGEPYRGEIIAKGWRAYTADVLGAQVSFDNRPPAQGLENAVPVYLMTDSFGYGVVAEVPSARHDLDSASVQDRLAREAGRTHAANLAALAELREALKPTMARLRLLRRSAKGSISARDVAALRDTARRGLVTTLKFFNQRP